MGPQLPVRGPNADVHFPHLWSPTLTTDREWPLSYISIHDRQRAASLRQLSFLSETTGRFSSWISLSQRPETETERLNFGLRPKLRLTDPRIASSLTSSAIRRWFYRISLFSYEWAKNEVIFVRQNLISNWLTYLVHAKSTGELISFGFSDRPVRSLVSAKRSANRWVQRLHFLADLWSQSEFRTRRKTDPKSEMTHCMVRS